MKFLYLLLRSVIFIPLGPKNLETEFLNLFVGDCDLRGEPLLPYYLIFDDWTDYYIVYLNGESPAYLL